MIVSDRPMILDHRIFLATRPRASRRRGGFSFAEVMFAVIVLGVGFIMVAAIFPVAIQQTKTTADETTAAAAVRGATMQLGQSMLQIATPANQERLAFNGATSGTFLP